MVQNRKRQLLAGRHRMSKSSKEWKIEGPGSIRKGKFASLPERGMALREDNEMKPNLLFITVDQMRWDCLGIAGHPLVETPNLDRLAANGALFRSSYTATPSCIPARAAMLTGMSQRSHGRVGYQVRIPWKYEHTLPGELAKAGYHTQCVGKMHVSPARNLCGFHNIVLHDGYLHESRKKSEVQVDRHYDQVDDYLVWLRKNGGAENDMNDLGLDCNASTVARPYHLPEHLHPTNWTVSQSIDFLRRRDPDKPFFLMTSFVRPHPPMDPPQAYFDMYKDADMPDPQIGDWVDIATAERGIQDPTALFGKLPKRRLNRARAGYYALISHIDDQIGRLLQALQEYGVLNNTLIIFTSDHGEMMGDHHYFRKALPYEGSAKVPLVICDFSGRLGLKRGLAVDEVVELRDIMPTFLDAAGVPAPDSVDGQSLLPLCKGEQTPWRDYIHGEHAYGQLSSHYVTDGYEKYIWFSQTGREQFFDLRLDPNETNDLSIQPLHVSRIEAWRQRLICELEGREEGYVLNGSLVQGQRPQTSLNHILA